MRIIGKNFSILFSIFLIFFYTNVNFCLHYFRAKRTQNLMMRADDAHSYQSLENLVSERQKPIKNVYHQLQLQVARICLKRNQIHADLSNRNSNLDIHAIDQLTDQQLNKQIRDAYTQTRDELVRQARTSQELLLFEIDQAGAQKLIHNSKKIGKQSWCCCK